MSSFEEIQKYSSNPPDNLSNWDDKAGTYTTGSDGFVDYNPDTGRYENPNDPFVQWNPETGTYESPDIPEESQEYYNSLNDTHYAFPATRGAAVKVFNELSDITFVEGSSEQMSSAIAYIRYWTRNGTQQKTAVGQVPQQGYPEQDSQEKVLSDYNQLATGQEGQAPVPTTTPEPTRTVLAVPENTAYQSRPRQPVPVQVPGTANSSPSIFSKLGKIFSANPGGTIAPESVRPWYRPADAPDPDNAVWQFMFNPEELQLSSGPDFNRAETWAVADPANEGQPLAWRGNKNRKLTFSKVLLHGYTFGKRVDSLERGLQALFMARDGENGSDGPPVLEFVWGKRVFGPCVIQNIQVREKAWDKGILVNAEVSFELEQVPEWTINDGFVDVLRPGRQSTVNDSLAAPTQGSTQAAEEEDDKPADRPGGGNEKPRVTGDPALCKKVLEYSARMQKVFDQLNNVLGNPFINQKKEFERGLDKYRAAVALPRSDFKDFIRNRVSKQSRGCIDISLINDIVGENPANYFRGIQYLNGCSKLVKKTADDWLRQEGKGQGKCVQSRKQRQIVERKKKKEEKCKLYRDGGDCSSRQAGSSVTCDGVVFYCRRLAGKNKYGWTSYG